MREMLGQGLECAGVSLRERGDKRDGPPVVSYICVPDTSYGPSMSIKRHGDETEQYKAVTLVARLKSRFVARGTSPETQ